MRNFLIVLLSLLVSGQVFAGGKLTGTITDGGTGEALIGVTITLKQADKADPVASTMTDIDGKFIIEADAGTYELQVEYIGYQTKSITDIEIKDNQSTPVAISLSEPAKNQIEEVVIRGSLKKETINALYTAQKNSAAVSDGISADVIRKSPDRSTGEVLKRVSGTTIQDNKFVIVRGLTDRYNTALVDNAILPSTEPNRKAFSFDIIPSSMIDNIIITKSGTPDLPGDFAGGVINILTKEIPDENYNSISIGTGFNTASTGRNFKSGYRSSTDFLGFDNGDRKLPSSIPSSEKMAAINPTVKESIPLLSALNNNFEIKEHTALPQMNIQAGLGRVYNLKGNSRFGVTAALTYNHNELIKRDLIRQYDNYDYKDNIYGYSSNLGALLNFGYYYKNSKITLKTLYNRIFDDNFLYREGYNNGSSSFIRYYAFDLIQKSLFKTTLNGEHQVGKKQSKLAWMLSYNLVTNSQPDQRKISYSQREDSGVPFMADVTTLGKSNNRLFGSLNESIFNGGLDYSLPFNFLQKSMLKIGLFGQYRYRDFQNRMLGAVIVPAFDEIRAQPIQQLFSAQNINNGSFTYSELTTPGDAYKAFATTAAGYLMLDNKITDKFRVVWGARIESYNINLETTEKTEVDKTWTDVLPSANLTYSLNDKSNLRASYFRSVVRPELREMANLGYYDYELSATLTGNTGLDRTLINNLDLRYEWFPNPGEIFSASVFFKDFTNTLENYVYGDASAYNINPANYSKATNIGAEIELRKKLDFISESSFIKNMNFYANFAYIKSSVKIDDPTYNINGKVITERPLSGQSPYVLNTSLGYLSDNGKLSLNVLYNVIGQRIYLVGQGRVGHVYESPRNLLDFQASYAVSKKSEFRLNIKDILNNNVRFYFDQNADNKFNGSAFSDGTITLDKDWILQQYKPGTTFSLTYSYKF